MTTLKQYGASWCNPCKTLKPILQEVMGANPTVGYQYIDVDQHPEDAQQNGVRSVPTVIVTKNGIETSRFVGVQPRAIYEQAIK